MRQPVIVLLVALVGVGTGLPWMYPVDLTALTVQDNPVATSEESVAAGRTTYIRFCASCHGTPPTAQGKHASTGKPIAPLAPAFNPKAFTDTAKVDKWFRRNCNDVLSRECTAVEKADVLAYLNALKP